MCAEIEEEMTEEILVSIICNAYNHEKYIRDALEGFVMQKTNFKYEILVHDDASTDKTADIIREYEEMYPDIIKPIYQKENQYSQGVKIGKLFQFPRVKGKYIAMCEGDDYWIDPLKLQKQVDAMEAHPEVDICAHAAYIVSDGEKLEDAKIVSPSKEDAVLAAEQVIIGSGGYVATNSLLYRSEINKEMPLFRQKYSLDYSLQMHGSFRGGMLFLADKMSVYRFMTEGSWTRRTASSRDLMVKNWMREQELLNQMDIDTNGEFKNAIETRKTRISFNIARVNGDCREIIKRKYREHLKALPKKTQLKTYLIAYFPILQKFKRKMTAEKEDT